MEFLAELFNEFPNLVVNVSHQGITLLRNHDQSEIINKLPA